MTQSSDSQALAIQAAAGEAARTILEMVAKDMDKAAGVECIDTLPPSTVLRHLAMLYRTQASTHALDISTVKQATGVHVESSTNPSPRKSAEYGRLVVMPVNELYLDNPENPPELEPPMALTLGAIYKIVRWRGLAVVVVDDTGHETEFYCDCIKMLPDIDTGNQPGEV